MSVGFVRRTVATSAHAHNEDVAQVVELIFSELVTNTIRHAKVPLDARIEVVLMFEDGTVRGSVRDPGVGFPGGEAKIEPGEDGGYGLLILDKLASRWGVKAESGATEVWFEI